MPHVLLELPLSAAIAIDSGGLQSRITTPTDHSVASRLYKRSDWSNENFYDNTLNGSRTAKMAKNDLDHLRVRDLLRRDWKNRSFVLDRASSLILTDSLVYDRRMHRRHRTDPQRSTKSYSSALSIQITTEQSVGDFFAIERDWTSEIEAGITLVLLGYKVKVEGNGIPSLYSETVGGADEDYPDWLRRCMGRQLTISSRQQQFATRKYQKECSAQGQRAPNRTRRPRRPPQQRSRSPLSF
ncbi:hypothetical protein BCV69DRAFT_211955 [Microstroma glucosiphilum]|uniref:Uncharacterized protein n=1 Tax=Pseudomicrostroma glucosiphilum TaxID=1684307 RepID=A0A316U5I3_9BASI|nr:hypothetical protein BCV69DRAFT_211955 [Pseudomicrostroma glucosiphilum]PWN20517.1 hypothetical protein BCV69DRAFT_211955 [Pseudomicrostroma glucosiphilum]